MPVITELEQAARRARRLYRAPGFRSTYVRGARAAVDGLPIDACPYPRDPGKTWQGAYRAAWLGGYQSIAPVSDG